MARHPPVASSSSSPFFFRMVPFRNHFSSSDAESVWLEMLAARGAGHRRRCGTCGGTHRLCERLSGLLLSSDVLIESPIGAFFLPFGMAPRGTACARARPPRRPSLEALWISGDEGTLRAVARVLGPRALHFRSFTSWWEIATYVLPGLGPSRARQPKDEKLSPSQLLRQLRSPQPCRRCSTVDRVDPIECPEQGGR